MKAILDSIKATTYTLTTEEVTAVLIKYLGKSLTKQDITKITEEIIKLCAPENIICEIDGSLTDDLQDYIIHGEHYDLGRRDCPQDDPVGKRIFWDSPSQNFSSYFAYLLNDLTAAEEKKLLHDLNISSKTFRYWTQEPSKTNDTYTKGSKSNKSSYLFSEPIRPSLEHMIRICFSLSLSAEKSLKLLQLSGHGDLAYASTPRMRQIIYLLCHCTAIPWEQCYSVLSQQNLLSGSM